MSFGSGFGGFQGGGGGFMTEESQTNLDSSLSEVKQRKDKVQSLIPCTVAMLYQAKFDKVTDVFKFDDIELHQVSIVGVIREVQESSTNLLFKVDDMTADSIIVRRWMDPEDSGKESKKRSQCREDAFVRVYGHVKSFQDTPCLIAFSILPVSDPNEISYHMIDVVHSFLAIKKGPSIRPPAGNASEERSPMSANRSINAGGADAFRSGGGGQSSGLNGPHKQVLDAIIDCQDEEGIALATLKSSLRNLNNHDLKKALEFLSNEGHIYSTIDDDHYRSTSM
eukprot:gene4687-5302_t